jgi:type IV pilus assembly protein PilB
MANEKRPGHLRPVPTGDEATARQLEDEAPANNGVTPPLRRGHPGMFISDVIAELGYASRERVDEVVNEARVAGKSPESLLRESQVIDSDQLARAIAERYGLDHIDLNIYKVDMGAANLLSMSTARRYKALPVGYVDKDTLLLAMADPANVLAVDDIQMMTDLNCRVAVAAEEDIDALISRLNRLEHAVSDAVLEEEEAEGDAEVTELHETAEDAPVIKLVHSVLAQAVNEGASDIHFEPEEGEMRVRFRVDGVLYESARVPKRMTAGVVSRVKLMADMDIAEKRLPQDGRVSVTVDDRKIDLRVTTLPTQRGEGASVRILDKEQALRTLDELGMDGEAREVFQKTVQRPYGAVVVTGPTGSGKSTTLYAALLELNAVERNIITIEDPVEYRVAGVNQMNVNRKAGLSFATGLRSILRADPDVIMVGEIRDAETARIAVESALTGHMVLSTLHTNDAPGAIARLAEMGIESFLTASAVECVVAQRLARQLCTSCKRRTVIPQHALVESGFRVGADLEAYEPVGCARCGHTGYRGRIGLFSVMVMSEEIKSLTVQRAPDAEIAEVARAQGMITVREDGLRRARAGVTSIEEIARVTT